MSRIGVYSDGQFTCYSNVTLSDGQNVFTSVTRNGVTVKNSKLGLFGPKLYKSVTVDDASTTAMALHVLYPDYITPPGITNIILRAFTNAILHCSRVSEVSVVLNRAIKNVDLDSIEPNLLIPRP